MTKGDENSEKITCVGCEMEIPEDESSSCGGCGEPVCADCIVETGPQALGATELCPACAEEYGNENGEDDEDDENEAELPSVPAAANPTKGQRAAKTKSTATNSTKAGTDLKKPAAKRGRTAGSRTKAKKTPAAKPQPRPKRRPAR